MKEQIFKGSAAAIVTPMFEDGRVNYAAFDQLIEFQLQNHTDAIVVCGTTGEASALNDEEHLDVIGHCVENVAGRVPVIAGTGSNDTRHAVSLSAGAKERGADALLQVTPYYNKTNANGLVRHFTTIADTVGLPIILYNVPSRTGMTISVPVYKELAKHPLIVATKEASGDIAHIANVAAACGEQLAIYSGNDDQVLPILALGGLGVISVLANVVPREMHNMCQSFFEGDVAQSRRLQLAYLKLNNALFSDVNPIPVKAAVEMLGIEAGPCRLPLGALSEDNLKQVRTAMKTAGVPV